MPCSQGLGHVQHDVAFPQQVCVQTDHEGHVQCVRAEPPKLGIRCLSSGLGGGLCRVLMPTCSSLDSSDLARARQSQHPASMMPWYVKMSFLRGMCGFQKPRASRKLCHLDGCSLGPFWLKARESQMPLKYSAWKAASSLSVWLMPSAAAIASQRCWNKGQV